MKSKQEESEIEDSTNSSFFGDSGIIRNIEITYTERWESAFFGMIRFEMITDETKEIIQETVHETLKKENADYFRSMEALLRNYKKLEKRV